MRIGTEVNKESKTVCLYRDMKGGQRFTMALAERIFDLQDKGYTICFSNKTIAKKFKNFEVAYWRR